MKKTVKIVFAFLLIVCSYIFTSIYIISDDIERNYRLSRDQRLEIDSFMPVTAVYNDVKMSQDVYNSKIGESFEVQLKLFGVIPFSTTKVEIIEDMYVEVLGQPFGMKIYTDGVLVIESSDIETQSGKINPAKKAGIKVGDYIKSVNGNTVTCNEDLLQIITQSNGETLDFEVSRGKKSFNCKVTPVIEKDTGLYRAGIWVRDSSAGVGTLSFYDPSSNIVCGLGHGICDSDTGTILEIESGEIVKAEIISVVKGASGSPGALKGKLTFDSLADISLNCDSGVYGTLKKQTEQQELTQIALKQEVYDGNAQIFCTVNGNTPKLYDCKIKRTGDRNSKTQNLIVTVTDKELIDITGGIVQGMSGSPILQDGKLVGALTHVLVDDSKTGYGIYAENMLSTAQSVGTGVLDGSQDKELKKAS
ncbi:MAG: SpoIVB peptidase [Clostridia bacterium]|nr:SpoIVB peptidase [Clostridia bacterium]